VSKLVVLKLSGHLINRREVIEDTLGRLKSLTEVAKFVLVPGGSVFADFVRELQGRIRFSDDTAHWLAIKAMEMYGTYIASLDVSNTLLEAYDLAEVHDALSRGKIPILMPYRVVRTLDKLPHSWNVTSDSIAIHVGELLKASLVVLAKPVDGILDSRGNLVREMCIEELKLLSTNVIDPYAVELLQHAKLQLAIYNMLKPSILNYIINEKPGDYTLIKRCSAI